MLKQYTDYRNNGILLLPVSIVPIREYDHYFLLSKYFRKLAEITNSSFVNTMYVDLVENLPIS